MDFREMLISEHARTHAASTANPDNSIQDSVLRDVSEAQLRASPQAGFNSFAWLFWHMTRTEDVAVNLIVCEQPQVFDSGGWGAKMNVERRDFGAGMTGNEVDELNRSIDIPAMFAYRDAVGRQTQAVVRELDTSVLDQVLGDGVIQRLRDEGALGERAGWVADRWAGKRKAYTLGHTTVGHNLMHLGQAEINRGLFGLPTA